MKKYLFVSTLLILIASVAYAYDIAHPNLRDAFGAADNAIHHIQRAQAANQGVEFGGHAEKAIELLKQAQAELIEGDRYNEAHRRR
jgi:hypothetical protein